MHRRPNTLPILAVALGFVASGVPGTASQGASPASPSPPPTVGAADPDPRWKHALAWLRGESDAFSADLTSAKEALLARAEREDPELAKTLRGSPAPEVERGYQVLPRLLVDPGLSAVTPRRQAYSLEQISTVYAWAMRDAAVLARVAADEREPLDELAKTYERLRSKHANLEEHIAYHAYWQNQVTSEAEFFAERNSVLSLIEEWNRLRKDPASMSRAAEVRADWFHRLAPFSVTPGLKLEEQDGRRVLAVTVTTDIQDEAFLAAFETAVDAAFNACEAAIERRFRIDLHLVRVAPEELYPSGAPARASEILEEDHVARFPEGALVLTTGAASTHSYVGRSIVLGSDPLPPRTLAHEFGHLLGFRDAYLRAFEGDPNAPFGTTLVEWTGLLDDLMGDARRGRVSAEMIDRLIAEYGGEPE